MLSSCGMPVAMRSFETLELSECDVIGLHAAAFVADEKGKLVGVEQRTAAGQRTATLYYAQATVGNLVDDEMAKKNELVGVTFFEAMTREVVTTAPGGDDGIKALASQPPEETAQSAAQDGLVGKADEKNLRRVTRHA